MDIEFLVKITARAWALRILALMHRGTPGRQAQLLAATGAGRTAFGQSLDHLITLGLIERTPGHGHPLRPEYRLTRLGARMAKVADQIDRLAPQTAENTLIRRAWTVPILAVSAAPRSFSHIKHSLPRITDRALSQSLKHLQERAWIHREVAADHYPPRALYQAANTGIGIAQAVGLILPGVGDQSGGGFH